MTALIIGFFASFARPVGVIPTLAVLAFSATFMGFLIPAPVERKRILRGDPKIVTRTLTLKRAVWRTPLCGGL